MAKLFICGDIVNNSNESGFVDDSFNDIFKSVDYVIGNLEGPELRVGELSSKPSQLPGTIEQLHQSGFNLMLLANNHITELGKGGILYTRATLSRYGLEGLGAGATWDETYKPIVKQIAGITFGFMNVCEAQVGHMISKSQDYGYAWLGYDQLLSDVRCLSKEVDKLIVFVHAGLEHYPIPLPELKNLYRRICDEGASAVIGGHTHSPQGYEFVNDKFICYSLGNFFFPRKNNDWEDENSSYSIVLEFSKTNTIKCTPIYHQLKNNKVVISHVDEVTFNLNNLCLQLTENYDELATKMCVKAYKNLCSKLLASSLVGEYENMTAKDVVKNIIRITLFRKKYINKTKQQRHSLLLRLFENESYRYTIIRALKNI